ncbi:hypothetical protein GCM10029964_095200 [Kibdelosporangium lantanae]
MSRKRKKKSGKSGRSRGAALVEQRWSGTDLHDQGSRELADALRGLTAYREHVDARRASSAAKLAADMVADLVAVAVSQPDMLVEDELCLRLGALLSEAEQSPVDDRPRPRDLAEAVVVAAAAAVEATEGEAEAWRAPWRVLTAAVDILPYPDSEIAVEAIARLRDATGMRMLPATPPGPMVTGPVLWTRDQYGSRFAVAAPVTTADQPVRWYLWDIDACGHQAFTVHSGFYPTADAALRAWQAGVGEIAAAGTEFAEVNDPWLLAELLPAEEGLLRIGGESAEQFAEYHRSKRLAEVVRQVVRPQGTRPEHGLDAAAAAVEFAAWMRRHDAANQELPEDLDELVAELADSWSINDIDALFATCSPHRVALCVLHVRSFYLDDFADQLVALLPEWTRWLAARNTTPPVLADRCVPYALGRPHSQVGTDDVEPDYLARVTE